MSHRNLEYLHRNRIVYRAYPENDKPTESYWWGNYYEDGTHECYELFKSKAFTKWLVPGEKGAIS